ncbi:hypothetical protein Tco_1193606 [Tanacetum coccineum]
MINHYVEPYVPPIPFPNRLKRHVDEALIHKTMESLKKTRINWPLLKEIRQTDNYPKYMKDLVANKQLTEEDDEVSMNPRCSALLQNQLPPKENDPGSFILPCSIRRLDFNNALADLGASISITPFSMMPAILGRPLLATTHAKVDIFRMTISLEVGNEKKSENDGKRIEVEWENLSLNDWLNGNEYDDNEDFKDPNGCGESKENEIRGTIINKLHDEWFKGTDEDDDDLEGIIDYLEPTLYDGFIDSDDEEY